MTGKMTIKTYIQTTMFPELDRRLAALEKRMTRQKKNPVETELDLFPHIETQMVFEDYFPGFLAH